MAKTSPTPRTVADWGEWGVIDYVRTQFRSTLINTPLGIGDDAAIVTPTRKRRGLAVTTDVLVEGVHFTRATTPPKALGHKALAANVSDIAAMGGIPQSAVMSLALPPETPASWVKELCAGLKRAAVQWRVALVGGDTSAAPHDISLTITIVGEVPHPVLRSTAQPDDDVYITGTVGDAALGWLILSKSGKSDVKTRGARSLIRRFHFPEPRHEFGRAVAPYASAMIDISDGVLADMGHLCKESGVQAVLDKDAIPLSSAFKQFVRSPAARTVAGGAENAFATCALAGGEDYELLFTAPPAKRVAAHVRWVGRETGLAVRRVGRIHPRRKREEPVVVKDAEGRRLDVTGRGFSHFSV